MRILLVSSGSGSRGGGEIYLRYLASGLGSLGHEIGFLCSDSPRMDELALQMEQFATVSRLPLRNTYDRRTRLLGAVLDCRQQKLLCKFFRERNPDVIHLNQQVAEDGLDFLIAADRSQIPFVSTIHIAHGAKFLAARLGKFRDAVAASVLRRIGAVHILVSRQAAAVLESRTGSGAIRTRVIYNGIPREESADISAAREQVRAEWNVGRGDMLLGSMGRLEAQKNPLFLLEVLAAVRSSGIPAKLVWLGDGDLAHAYLDRAKTLRLSNAVINDGWRGAARRRLHGLDIFVMASKFEGLPLALLEAMYAGLPCCVSDCDGMPEAIEHGRTGYVCALDDAANWSQAIVGLATNPRQRHQLGKAASAEAKQRFSLVRMATETEAVYQSVIFSKPPSWGGVSR